LFVDRATADYSTDQAISRIIAEDRCYESEAAIRLVETLSQNLLRSIAGRLRAQ
jgi:hypothetical protein